MNRPDVMNILKAIVEAEKANGCYGCAYDEREEWEAPCKMCKRGCKDYWRRKTDAEPYKGEEHE